MEIDDFLAALRLDGPLLVGAARSAGLDARVPSCPEWDVRELVRHVAGVHHWAAAEVGGRRTDEIEGDLVDIVGGWPPDDELLDWAAGKHAALVRTFDDADPDFPYFTWFEGRNPLHFWTRRQAHETAIHRVDAELAAGAGVTSFEPVFAADGVDELLLGMIGAWRRDVHVAGPRCLRLSATDVERSWTAVLRPDGFEMHGEAVGDADTTITGRADALYRTVWNRADDLRVDGDPAVVAAWRESVRPRWS